VSARKEMRVFKFPLWRAQNQAEENQGLAGKLFLRVIYLFFGFAEGRR